MKKTTLVLGSLALEVMACSASHVDDPEVSKKAPMVEFGSDAVGSRDRASTPEALLSMETSAETRALGIFHWKLSQENQQFALRGTDKAGRVVSEIHVGASPSPDARKGEMILIWKNPQTGHQGNMRFTQSEVIENTIPREMVPWAPLLKRDLEEHQARISRSSELVAYSFACWWDWGQMIIAIGGLASCASIIGCGIAVTGFADAFYDLAMDGCLPDAPSAPDICSWPWMFRRGVPCS